MAQTQIPLGDTKAMTSIPKSLPTYEEEFIDPSVYHTPIQDYNTGKTLAKPIIVPRKLGVQAVKFFMTLILGNVETTNIFFVKHLTPFARCYPPVLAELPNPIHQDEFLAFIDCLNDVFVAQPALLATAMVGGALMGTQILPAQIAGGAVQVAAVGTSAFISFWRVRRYMLEVNRTTFAPKGLKAVIMSTKKMMADVSFQGQVDAKGKLVLPALSEVSKAAFMSISTSRLMSPPGSKRERRPSDEKTPCPRWLCQPTEIRCPRTTYACRSHEANNQGTKPLSEPVPSQETRQGKGEGIERLEGKDGRVGDRISADT